MTHREMHNRREAEAMSIEEASRGHPASHFKSSSQSSSSNPSPSASPDTIVVLEACPGKMKMPVLVVSPARRSSPFGPRTLISGL